MPKGARGKSSASSATRKKQAAKAAKKNSQEDDPSQSPSAPAPAKPQRGQKKDKSKDARGKAKWKQPKKKQFIPPPKPPQPLPDPLDSLGLASLLPADLVLLLRKASKKDVITRCRALEGLLTWVQVALSPKTDFADRERDAEALVMMLPCWAHLFPRLALSPTRRLRLLTSQIQELLLEKPIENDGASSEGSTGSSTRSELLLSPSYIEAILGPWAILSHDTEKTIERKGKQTWQRSVAWRAIGEDDQPLAGETTEADSQFVDGRIKLPMADYSSVLLDHLKVLLHSESPSAALAMTSAHVASTAAAGPNGTGSGAVTPLGSADAKNRDDNNVEEDSAALDKRLVAGAISALTWVISSHPDPASLEGLESLLLSERLWSSLSPFPRLNDPDRKPRQTAAAPFGHDSPGVRARAWSLLRAMHLFYPDMVGKSLPYWAPITLSAAWAERDVGVQRNMLDALLPVLKSHPQVWEIQQGNPQKGQAEDSDGDSSDEDEDEDAEDEEAEDDDEEDDDAEDGDGRTDTEVTSKLKRLQADKPEPASYMGFKSWLQSCCAGSPTLGFPAVLVFISTIPTGVLPTSSYEACSTLLSTMFSALDSRVLDSDPSGSRSFLESFIECAVYLCAKISRSGETESQAADYRLKASKLAEEQLGRVWRELVLGLPPVEVGEVDEGKTQAEDKARRVRMRTMGDLRIADSFGGSLRKLSLTGSDGAVAQRLLELIECDLTRISEDASAPSLSQRTLAETDFTAGLDRAIVSLSIAAAETSKPQPTEELRQRLSDIVVKVTRTAAKTLTEIARVSSDPREVVKAKADVLVGLMTALVRSVAKRADIPSQETEVLSDLVDVASRSIPTLMTSNLMSASLGSVFLAAYLPICPLQQSRNEIWHEVLESVARMDSIEAQAGALNELMVAADALRRNSNDLDASLSQQGSSLDDVCLSLAASLCDPSAAAAKSRTKIHSVVAKLLDRPSPFIEQSVADQMLSLLTSTIEQLTDIIFKRTQAESSDEVRAASQALFDLLGSVTFWLESVSKSERIERLVSNPSLYGVVPSIFSLAFLQQQGSLGVATHPAASRLWSILSRSGDKLVDARIQESARNSLKTHLAGLIVPVRLVVDATEMLSSNSVGIDMMSILPDDDRFDDMMVEAATDSNPKAELSIIDHLVPQVFEGEGSEHGDFVATSGSYDQDGLSPYARCAYAAGLLLQSDSSLARSSASILPHLTLLSLLAEDELLLRSTSSSMFSRDCPTSKTHETMVLGVNVATVMLSGLTDELARGWHSELVSTLQRKQISDPAGDRLGHILSKLWKLVCDHAQSPNLARLFGRLLSGCLSFGSIETTEAERWLKLGQSAQETSPALSRAVVLVIKPMVQSATSYDRLRNEVAARLSGVPPSKANTEGLNLLRMAIAAAPSADSDLAMIPQQRAIFLLQGLQRWLASDEDLDEEINNRMAELFVHLVPIVQDMPGSHIELFFDLAEANLEIGSLSDESTLPGLYHALRLVETLRDYSLRSATLREVWKERNGVALGLIRDLYISMAEEEQPLSAVERQRSASVSVPKELCSELVVDLVKEVPSSSFSSPESMSALCKLIRSSPIQEVQVVSYRILSAAVKEQVKELVVETAIGIEESRSSEKEDLIGNLISEALLSNVRESMDAKIPSLIEEAETTNHRSEVFGYLLSWIALFDHFEEASLQLKTRFVSELQREDLVELSLLPCIFSLVGLGAEDGRKQKQFDPSKWVIDEVFLDELDNQSLQVIQVLACHVYFRALIHVPTIVRNWWMDIKDRQLTLLVSSFTTKFCTPLIAERELSHLREPEALSKLQDEAMNVKISNTTNEVIATYTVDEHPMEIGVRIPADFPLHGVEIMDLKRVGVSEAQWRAWLLAVQQLITGQNGLIFDAISLFKSNAEAKFAGFEGAECAICYSIISPMDRSLPTKPCKTCKNKFHAGCLFKWISTSGASTCPLCRSIL
ncbi:hypothetical protein IE53DRAFT_165426 [Violaceomyces palustris]|uniref:Uncharacterized protein n=1 Tax=Violaceomyces palustris TaxID=1673888 RepID=A0ACD0P5Z9_9BASI|nr:hypothetical protein IE53DRAFT_165426 [Violaceomyces palustris]